MFQEHFLRFVFLLPSCYNEFIPINQSFSLCFILYNETKINNLYREVFMSQIPWNIYPRPQLQRDSFFCLNGEWEFHDASSMILNTACTTSGDAAPASFALLPRIPDKFSEKIQVPFPPQSSLSMVTASSGADFEFIFYRRKVRIPNEFAGKRILLHFGAVDQIADVYWNGIPLTTHEGGYLPFTIELTGYLDSSVSENELVLCVKDTLDHTYPYGKQRKDRGGMWYTPVSGIWQTVWMEAVPQTYITNLKITPCLDRVVIEVETDGVSLDSPCTFTVSDAQIFDGASGNFDISIPSCNTTDECASPFRSANKSRTQATLFPYNLTQEGNCYTITLTEPKHWTPESPYIYEFTVTAGEDTVRSYFALRTLETKNIKGIPRLCLNGKPYFFHGLLDQGYFHDGIFLPETPQGYIKDILTMKQLGFNMLRKHIKIEPEYFYTACDYLGMVVFQDFVNNSDYSFFRDTALPTVGLQKLPNTFLRRNEAAKQFFVSHSRETVKHLYNHPCICQWTIFNEGWGQFDADRLYELTKQWDSTRFIDTTSGWFRESKSDVESRHVYFKKVKPVKSDKPFFLSEFGGYCYAVEGHLYDPEKSYGYRNCKTQEAFMDALEALYLEQIVPLVKEGLCATVYTQVSDVEEEINGLFTYDREVLKVDKSRMLSIAKKLYQNLKTAD